METIITKDKFCYDYPRAAVTTDSVIFKLESGTLGLLLIERKHDPYKNCWALPGGFLEMNEDGLECARRELLEETSLAVNEMEQTGTYTDVNRDPRGRTISIAYTTLITNKVTLNAGDDAKNVKWFSLFDLPLLAFDHIKVIQDAVFFFQVRLKSDKLPDFLKSLDKQQLKELQNITDEYLK
ncbi:NUDIX domain-containing protein [Sporocytophaga myxococcoides]|uniref:NUDIX domain-containing protein n=1 Tax=Sporocytophaga myxococcoides TaxID=153721 RepID=UPI0003FEB23A|nr:NUDIX hydrolase [Sporocytophaga myxococcoides]